MHPIGSCSATILACLFLLVALAAAATPHAYTSDTCTASVAQAQSGEWGLHCDGDCQFPPCHARHVNLGGGTWVTDCRCSLSEANTNACSGWMIEHWDWVDGEWTQVSANWYCDEWGCDSPKECVDDGFTNPICDCK